MSAPALPTPLRRRRPLLGRYALWQARDFVMNVFVVSLVLFVMIGWLFHMNISANLELARARAVASSAVPMQLMFFKELLAMFATVAPIIAVSGVVSTDRTSGYTRFLFSKPLSPIAFYAQSLLVRFVGFVVLGVVLQVAWSRLHPPAADWKFVADITICFFSIGGIVFLASVLSRFDGLIAIVFLLMSAVFWGKWEHVSGVKHWVTWLMPPVTRLGDVHDWYLGLNVMGSLADIPFPTKWALWNGGFGLACVLLGLVMLRKVPLTKA